MEKKTVGLLYHINCLFPHLQNSWMWLNQVNVELSVFHPLSFWPFSLFFPFEYNCAGSQSYQFRWWYLLQIIHIFFNMGWTVFLTAKNRSLIELKFRPPLVDRAYYGIIWECPTAIQKRRRKNEYIRIYWTNTLSKPIQWNEFQTIRIIPLITFNRVFPSPFINGEHKINLKLLFYKSSWNCKITILQSGEEQRNKKKKQKKTPRRFG